MKSALVDEDIRPFEILEETVEDRIKLEIGVGSSEKELVAQLEGKDILFTTSRLPVTESVLEATNLEIVAKMGTGIDNIALDAARERDIQVVHTPGLNAQSVSEHTVGLIIAVCRNLVKNFELLANGNWRDEAELSMGVTGKTVGIIGFGRIGRRVAGLLSGFNTEILAYDPYVLEQDTDITGTELTSLDDLLSRSDIITVNAALTDETRGMIGRREFDLMDDSATLINTARGSIISEPALIEALEENRIGGAGLDVFETEPLPESSRLHDFDTVIATPHVSAMTKECRVQSIETLGSNVLKLLEGTPLPERYFAVDPVSQESNR